MVLRFFKEILTGLKKSDQIKIYIILSLIIFNTAETNAQPDKIRCAPGLFENIRERSFTGFTLASERPDDLQRWIKDNCPSCKTNIAYAPAGLLELEAPADFVKKQLLHHPLTLFIDRGNRTAEEEIKVPGLNLHLNNIYVARSLFPSFNGQGIVVSVKENAFDTTDIDIKGRIVRSVSIPEQQTNHAAFMATLIGGAGNGTVGGNGVAPACLLSNSSFARLLPDAPQDLERLNISVQNHSYGVSIENYYGAEALAYDISVRNQPALLHVFSSGNRGLEAPDSGPYKSIGRWANLSGNFKMAKNVLVVSGTDTLGNTVSFMSRGPAYDGRIKPDLSAFGQDGSSTAAALVSGAAALVQQAYRQRRNTLPPAALARAILINSADDQHEPGPDFIGGFGVLNVKKALQTIAQEQYRNERVAAGQVWSANLAVRPGMAALKITLVWDDPAAQAGAGKALVNDLNLRLVGPDGKTHLPWTRAAAASQAVLQLPAVRGVDTLNNVEQITVETPLPGSYALVVDGRFIKEGAGQDFSLCWEEIPAGDFQWIWPLKQTVAADASSLVQWSSADISKGQVEYKRVGDVEWTLVGVLNEKKKGFMPWQTPDEAGLAQLRLVSTDREIYSDTFLIAPEMRLRYGFVCADSMMIQWTPAAGAKTYQLYALGPRYMEPIVATRDSFIVLSKTQFQQTHFAVAPVINEREGLRSGGLAVANSGVRCYVQSLLGNLAEAGRADLLLRLSASYGLEKIIFEKWNLGRYVAIYETDVNDSFSFVCSDAGTVSGLNRYRARLRRKQGADILSDPVDVLSPGSQTSWLIAPTLLSAGGSFNVLAANAESAQIYIYDLYGKPRFDQELAGLQSVVFLPELPAGVYFYNITSNGKSMKSGKIVIHK